MAKRGINKVIILGNLGGDPEIRYMANGNAVANFTVATSESWKDKHTGEQKDQAEWHRIVVYGRLAEIAGEYLRKGAKVYLEGSIKTRKWTDQSGQGRHITEIVCVEMQMLYSASSGNGHGNQGQGGGFVGGNQRGGQQGNFGNRGQQQGQGNNGGGFGDRPPEFDDDIPF